MGLFRIFSGKSPETHEQRGDGYVRSGAFGDARIEYEKALEKIEKHYPEKAALVPRLNEKHAGATESLARSHVENADALIEYGNFHDARDFYILARDLTRDDAMKRRINEKLTNLQAEESLSDEAAEVADIAESERDETDNEIPDDADEAEEAEEAEELEDAEESEDEYEASDDEIFTILCHALPPEIEEAYNNYGEAFRKGYVALNRGEFTAAAQNLIQAIAENPDPANLIPLELATAFIHLKAFERARGMLETFIQTHPMEIRGYQLLCEICWETQDFNRTNRLFDEIPRELATELPILLLKGESRFQERAFDDAETIFRKALATHGEDEIISRALAKTLEAKGEIHAARDLYADIINKCTSCRKAIDPYLKQRYAELCFKSGTYNSKLTEIYLGLTREDPDNRAFYYRRVAEIYQQRGELAEARRFEELAGKTG